MLGFCSTSILLVQRRTCSVQEVVRRVRVQTCKRFQINIIFNLQKFVAIYKTKSCLNHILARAAERGDAVKCGQIFLTVQTRSKIFDRRHCGQIFLTAIQCGQSFKRTTNVALLTASPQPKTISNTKLGVSIGLTHKFPISWF